jgi:hypothetical protein
MPPLISKSPIGWLPWARRRNTKFVLRQIRPLRRRYDNEGNNEGNNIRKEPLPYKFVLRQIPPNGEPN